MKPAPIASGASRFGAFGRRLLLTALPIALVGLAACDDDDDNNIIVPPDEEPDTFALTFSGDASYQGAHAGDSIYVVVQDEAGTEVASDRGDIAAEGDSSFSFQFDDALEEDETYVIHYWIDSNFDGGAEPGTAGVCDPPEVDHQWAIDSTVEAGLANVSADVDFEDTHRPDDVEDVCASFEDFETGGGDGGGNGTG